MPYEIGSVRRRHAASKERKTERRRKGRPANASSLSLSLSLLFAALGKK